MDGVNEALYVTVSLLSDISSCRDHRSVTSSVTQCLWGDSVSGPCVMDRGLNRTSIG